MERFPDVLKSEISKNKQAYEALAKLETRGSISPFWNILCKLFDDESKSIINSKYLKMKMGLNLQKNYRRQLNQQKKLLNSKETMREA